ncbi:MAG: hypothetical protein A3E07_02890 [Candidatus Wildermuthbacteria bacterium RIFCSPHIGHO2_12_FULL_45_9]|uniref:Uncharacterized protein n=1 Tax=Candidatus Wildermuthbacteria bacterium RIFCSPHIGHO2_02_FULL_45_25 TaxID=1802450 RepID=A0A1G2R639_9BACT|nr:MAG: hypothetical protein A2748_01255 [Candidatus Wildermuthbacteria bacterium RIFCSPHIGHO2_01_FULL_45_20]OHA67849.1 MAG: hypothetical protein A3C04_02850 [Candidatus Wildermuthbacteria bacterium RIFCSPHIGHO2_02_FULL_45_25]OHA71074.1 MAG: hypothetical protein A3E07_02890 [Candidatus Wildermuthbacteria bacterium RIFCSPHIGHO2_12_FULL_45_9]
MALSLIRKKSTKSVSVPLTLEQIALSLGQLSPQELEVLEELIDPTFQKTILTRSKEITLLGKRKQTLSLEDLQKDFGK